MVVIDSPLAAQKYLRRISKDFSTVRRFSNTPSPASPANPNAPLATSHIGVSTLAVPHDALDIELPTTPRGIRKRQRLRKRSSVSSTLSKVLILNVRDLLKAQANNDDAAREEVPTPNPPRTEAEIGENETGGFQVYLPWQTVAHSDLNWGI